MPNSIFISYSHLDRDLKDELVRHLSPLKLAGLVSIWHDALLHPGEHLDAAIEAQLAASDVVILLLTSGFIASGYCTEREMVRAFERAAAGQARVVLIVGKPCQWRMVPVAGHKLGDFVALPEDGNPVATFPDRDIAWDQISGTLANMFSTTASLATEGRRRVQVVRTLTVYFRFGSHELGLGAGAVIEAAARTIPEGAQAIISIVGHCDQAEATEFARSDGGFRLSRDRARTVARALFQLGAEIEEVTINAQGAGFPVATSAGGKEPLDRRVTIEVATAE